MVMVYMPTGGPLLRDDDSFGEELMEICRSLGLVVVDLRAELRALNLTESQLTALTIRPEGRGHYTAQGNALVAKILRRLPELSDSPQR